MSLIEFFESRWRGLKIGAVGVLISFLGVALSFRGFGSFGPIVFVIGWLMALYGGRIHFRDFKREMMTPREERYPQAEQPWEK